MKNQIKKILCGALAAFVLVATVPAESATVYAATKSATSATAQTEVTVKKPSKVTTTAKKTSAKVTIKKVAGATGYQIQYATNKKMTAGKKTITTKKATYSITGLKSKKTYYVRMRSYKTVNGKKVYSKWTGIKKIKTK